jgi:flavin-dependent dehydrogenase
MVCAKKTSYDVVIIGGAISGSATALMLKQKNPQISVCIVEKNSEFERKVGESTVEVSSYFLDRVLGLRQYLNEHHIVKQGLRFWFFNEASEDWKQCSEIGPEYHVRLPGYQLDRAELDEHLLGKAVESGVELLRAWKVTEVDLDPGGTQKVTIAQDENEQLLESKWVVDAGGVQSFLARKLGVYEKNKAHPISSIWSRWKGVASLDAPEFTQADASYAERCKGTRFTATNHFVGKGWWSWFIPLKNGDMSVGIVFDERIVDLSAVKGLKDKMLYLLNQHPMARKLLEHAEPIEGDMHFRRKLPYVSKQIFGEGFAMVGDAAGFIDPFYSPGLDWMAYTTSATVELITINLGGKPVAARSSIFNQRFQMSYQRWFEGIYLNKYHYMGDFELMNLAFKLDLGTYYFGVVSQPFRYGSKALQIPSFAGRYSSRASGIISAYNRRLSTMAIHRQKRGTWGRHNSSHFVRFQSYELNNKTARRVTYALFSWLKLELVEGWRTWFIREEKSATH